MTLAHLLERRAALRTEMQALHDAHPDGDLPQDVQARWDAARGEVATIESRMQRQAALDDLDRNAPARSVGGGAPATEVRVFSDMPSTVPPAFDGITLRSQTGARVPVLEARHRLADFLPHQPESRAAELGVGGFLRALHRGAETDLERRVMNEASIGAGGALVPSPLSAVILDAMRVRSAAFRAGVRTIPMTSQSLRLARVGDLPTGAWRAELAPIVEDDLALSGIDLVAKSWAVIVRVSRELLEDATNLDATLRDALGASAAIGLDEAILFGTGGVMPLGIANDPAINVVSMGANGGAVTGYGPFLDAALALDIANAGDITAMIFAPRTRRALDGLVDGDGNTLTVPRRFADVPQLVTSAMPVDQTQGTASNASSILLGDFRQVFVGMRTQLQISVLGERYAEVGQVGFLAWMRANVAVVNPTALAKITGVTPA
jgi:HK97 family phage major capsid protein